MRRFKTCGGTSGAPDMGSRRAIRPHSRFRCARVTLRPVPVSETAASLRVSHLYRRDGV